jgi:hypothetical protein
MESRWNFTDDCLLVRKDSQIEELIDELKDNDFNLKIENNLTDYLSCCVIQDVKLNQIYFDTSTSFN